jgi:hypothetical protein
LLIVSGAVEGELDQAVFQRLVRHVGAEPGYVHGLRGRPHLLRRLPGYNSAARYSPWVVLLDLDRDLCAPALLERHLPKPQTYMCCRVAVRSIESWLLADTHRLAEHLAVSTNMVPHDPDALPNAKHAMVNVARRSRRTDIRRAMVPGPRAARRVGPGYNGHLIEFVTDSTNGWRPDAAADASPSLERCLSALSEFLQRT